MSFPRYPKYKDSGVEWLGEVPEHWDVSRAKFLAESIKAGPFGSALTKDDYVAAGYRVYGQEQVIPNDFTIGDYFITPERYEELRQYSVSPGDILVSCVGTFGKIAIVPDDVAPGIINPRLIRFRCTDAIRAEYLVEVLRSIATFEQLTSLTRGGTMDVINIGTLNQIVVAVPPDNEQLLITQFLATEANRIDELVAEQRRLMELLKEKRQAVISHAVTKGLNPRAPMKPSNIEWLGDVPEHWEVKRLKFVVRDIKAGPFGSVLTKDTYVDAGYRVYGQEQVIPADFSIGDYFITPEKYVELSQYNVSPGDILISCVGTFGKIAIVPTDAAPGIINPRLIRLRSTGEVLGEYLVQVLQSAVTFEQLSSFTRGGTMDVINIGTLTQIFVAVPPKSEQQELLEFLRSMTTELDALAAEAQKAIDLLQERRTALISAAVTGQIDVRKLAAA